MSEEKPAEPPPLPEAIELDPAALERWLKVPEDRMVLVPFSRGDLDRLMLGLRQAVLGQMFLGDTLQAFAANTPDQAEEHFRRYAENSRFAYSNFNLFISHIMRSAQVDGGENGG